VEKRILIVMREPETREFLARNFSDHGFRPSTAPDGVGGLFQFGLTQPHLVVLEVNGWETLQRIRTLSTVPIIALIEDTSRNRIESLNRGADYFVTKPPSVQELQAKVRALLRPRPSLCASAVGLE
jgi:two-component system KDP operon response regulator KdpE